MTYDEVFYPGDVPEYLTATETLTIFDDLAARALHGFFGEIDFDRGNVALTALAFGTATRNRILAECWSLAILVLRLEVGFDVITAALDTTATALATDLVSWLHRGREAGQVTDDDHAAVLRLIVDGFTRAEVRR